MKYEEGLKEAVKGFEEYEGRVGAKLMMKSMGFAEALEPLVKEWVIKAIENTTKVVGRD